MGGNKNAGRRAGGSSSHAGKNSNKGNNNNSGGGRNSNPNDRRVVIKKGKGEMTALPGKELKAAANRMMAQVLKRRQNDEKHRPGADILEEHNKKKKKQQEQEEQRLRNQYHNTQNNNNGNDDDNDDDYYDVESDDDGVDHENDASAVADTLRQATALAVDARSRQAYHQSTQQALEESRKFKDQREGISGQGEFRERSLKKFFKNVKDVIDQSDVILEVVDSRDPMGCRLTNIEDMIESEFGGRKKIVVVMNKIDLLPTHHIPTSHYNQNNNQNNQQNNQEQEMKVPMVEWLRYFRENQDVKITEVCPFTCNSNKTVTSDGDSSANNNGGGTSSDLSSINQEWCVSNLYSILRRLATVDTGARKNINVGVLGYPNVGKSSIINALRGKNVVGVGNMPGFTVGNTLIDLRKDIKIIDCPGVVMPGEDMADIVLRNAAKVDKLNDPLIVVARLLARCDPVALAAYYDIPIPPSTAGHESLDEDQQHHAVVQAVSTFLKNVAWKRGRGIKQNGSIDEEEAARMVLKDWNDGRIQYYSLPPERLNNNFAFLGTAARNFNNGANSNAMLTSFTETSTVFGKSDLPRFFIQMPKGEAGANFRVAWSQDSMFIAPEGADAPINYNPLDNIDPATGLPYDYQVPGQKKNKNKNKPAGGSGGSNNNNEDYYAQQEQQASQMAKSYLDQLYGSAVSQD